MALTTDPNDPNLAEKGASGQNKTYLVLSDEERAKGYLRPLRLSYTHEKCGGHTTMNPLIAETYARDPKFYGRTFCTTCGDHFPVSEFVWAGTTEKVGS